MDIKTETRYGRISTVHWNKDKFNAWTRISDETLSNIEAIEAYIWHSYGDYYIYQTYVGDVYITENGVVLSGSVNIKDRNSIYEVIVNNLYGHHGLTILQLGHNGLVRGWCNLDGQGSPAIKKNTSELDADVIDRVLSHEFEDYGECMYKLMLAARNIYAEDKTNHIMSKTFELH